MAEFLLAHGAWHGGWCWRHVADLLRAGGHRVLTPTLAGPSNGVAVAAGWPMIDIDSGHELMATAPDATVAALLEVAGHQQG
jgi:hypothetical protein